MSDTMTEIQEMETYLNPLYKRMDRDRDIVRLNKYTLTGTGIYKDKEIPDTVSITMNQPAVFANAVTSILQNTTRQTRIEGQSDTQNKQVENLIDDCFYTTDKRLQARRIQSLWFWICDHVVKRGPIGARWTFDKNGLPRCLPVDIRYCPFREDDGELVMVANHTKRTVADIQKEYPKAKLPTNSGKALFDVYDCWKKNINEIWVAGNKAEEYPNPYGLVPFVIQFPSAGDYLLDEGYIEFQGESVFFLIRDLIPEWNRLMSIEMTKAIETVRFPQVHQHSGEGEEQPYAYKVGTNTPYKEGEKPELLQTQDINRAFQGAENGISVAMQSGSISQAELGDVSLDRTAVWIASQTEIRNKILLPRLSCCTSFIANSGDLLAREYQAVEFEDPQPIGRAGQKKVYVPDELGDPDNYTIEVIAMPDNKQQKLANYSVGIALKGTLSKDTIIRDIYSVDDPDGELDKIYAEEARQSNPIIFYFDQSSRLLDIADQKKGEEKDRYLMMAKIMADSMVEAIKRQKMQSVDQRRPEPQGTAELQLPKGNGQALLALPSMMSGKGTGVEMPVGV